MHLAVRRPRCVLDELSEAVNHCRRTGLLDHRLSPSKHNGIGYHGFASRADSRGDLSLQQPLEVYAWRPCLRKHDACLVTRGTEDPFTVLAAGRANAEGIGPSVYQAIDNSAVYRAFYNLAVCRVIDDFAGAASLATRQMRRPPASVGTATREENHQVASISKQFSRYSAQRLTPRRVVPRQWASSSKLRQMRQLPPASAQ